MKKVIINCKQRWITSIRKVNFTSNLYFKTRIRLSEIIIHIEMKNISCHCQKVYLKTRSQGGVGGMKIFINAFFPGEKGGGAYFPNSIVIHNSVRDSSSEIVYQPSGSEEFSLQEGEGACLPQYQSVFPLKSSNFLFINVLKVCIPTGTP